ncbi:hypothetical protein JX266_005797 [Neoarthrinium moseri]|nr:hypothetical protein JX266_005797 [Neoarthrinium moseri]
MKCKQSRRSNGAGSTSSSQLLMWLRVSPLQVGAMSFGGSWGRMLGNISREDAFKLLDGYNEADGKMVDRTKKNYQNGESEKWIGEWLASRQNRD